jgi:hypothetical protein
MGNVFVRPALALRLASIAMMLIASFSVMAKAGNMAPLPYAMRSYEQYSSLTNETWWKCTYPVFSGSPASEKINRILLDAVAGIDPSSLQGAPVSLQAAAAVFIRDFDEIRKDFPETMPYQSETTGVVVFNRSGRLTVGITFDAFTGGAHGMRSTLYYVFDTATGKRLTLNELFIPGFQTRLDALIDRRFRKMKGLSKSDRLDGDQGTLFENFIRHSENFAVTELGITFYYNPYEIAAYVYGPTAIDLKWQELKGILKP